MNKYTWTLNFDEWNKWFSKHHDNVPSLISKDIELSIMAESRMAADETLRSFIDETFWDFKKHD